MALRCLLLPRRHYISHLPEKAKEGAGKAIHGMSISFLPIYNDLFVAKPSERLRRSIQRWETKLRSSCSMPTLFPEGLPRRGKSASGLYRL